MTDLLELAESQNADEEYVPTILPVDARLAVRGPVEVFQSAFERAASVIPAKEIISGTTFALLEAVSGGPNSLAYIRVTATDGDMGVVLVADGVDVIMPGKVLIPGKKISEILKLAPTPTAYIEVLGNVATLRSGRAQWSVKVDPGNSLPPLADVSAIETHPVSAKSLLNALNCARKAATTAIGRASLRQICVRGGAITGLDGGRLHRQVVEGLPKALDFTIPLRASEEITRLLSKSDAQTAMIGGNSSHMVFHIDQDQVIAQRELVDYPDVEKIVLAPALTNTYTIALERQRLIDVIKRVRINADPDHQAIFLSLVPGKMTDEGMSFTLTVSARDRIQNFAQETMDISFFGPKSGRTLCVNHRYLSDLLSMLDSEHVSIKVGDDTKANRLPLYVEAGGFTGWVAQIRPGFIS